MTNQNNSFTKDILKNFRDLCPNKDSDHSSITISTKRNGKEISVTLTNETRNKIDRIIKKLNQI